MNVFRPHEYYTSICEINLDRLKSEGREALIIDLDETLIPKDLEKFPPEILLWIRSAKEKGFKICITSNSFRKNRVKRLAQILSLPFLALALKPLPKAFKTALSTLGSSKENTVMIGDQLFTDILGANLYGIKSIFVKPLTPEKFILRKWMRNLEELFFKGGLTP